MFSQARCEYVFDSRQPLGRPYKSRINLGFWETAHLPLPLPLPSAKKPAQDSQNDNWDQFRFLGNCPPTPPLSTHFALSEKQMIMLA